MGWNSLCPGSLALAKSQTQVRVSRGINSPLRNWELIRFIPRKLPLWVVAMYEIPLKLHYVTPIGGGAVELAMWVSGLQPLSFPPEAAAALNKQKNLCGPAVNLRTGARPKNQMLTPCHWRLAKNSRIIKPWPRLSLPLASKPGPTERKSPYRRCATILARCKTTWALTSPFAPL